MTPKQIRKILLRCGAEERKNNVHHRIYLNILSFVDLIGINGIEIKSPKGAGPICLCKIDNEILTCSGDEIKHALDEGTYFDLRVGHFCSPSQRVIDLLEDTIAHLKG